MLLLCNLRRGGHFPVYAEIFARWAASRGWRAGLAGIHPPAVPTPGLEFYDLRPALGLDPAALLDDAQALRLFHPEVVERVVTALADAQRALQPRWTVLLNTDDLLFNCPLESLPCPWPAPVAGVLTFGGRQRYAGFEELYTHRLQTAAAGWFSRLFSIDEFHVQCEDPQQRRLVFLPDMFRAEALPDPAGEALQAFLDAAPGPVIPLLGKMDARKNYAWVLEQAARHPALRIVMLGQWVDEPDMAQCRELAEALARSGRLFLREGYVPAVLFETVLAHPAVPFVPLPYLTHFTASGLHLHALLCGKPVLVPDLGLTALRTAALGAASGAGRLFRHADRDHFQTCFDAMLSGTGPAMSKGLRRGIENGFGPAAVAASLDYGFGLTTAPPALPGWVTSPLEQHECFGVFPLLHQALQALAQGDCAASLTLLEQARVLDPAHRGLDFFRGLGLLACGRLDEGLRLLAETSPVTGDLRRFLFRRMEEWARWSPATLPLDAGWLAAKLLPALAWDAESLLAAGSINIRDKCHPAAQACFARAIHLEPSRHDIRLNLSDVLRYQGLHAQSLAVLAELERLAPAQPGLHCKRGQVLLALGRTAEALDFFEKELQHPCDEFHSLTREHLRRIQDSGQA